MNKVTMRSQIVKLCAVNKVGYVTWFINKIPVVNSFCIKSVPFCTEVPYDQFSVPPSNKKILKCTWFKRFFFAKLSFNPVIHKFTGIFGEKLYDPQKIFTPDRDQPVENHWLLEDNKVRLPRPKFKTSLKN